MIAQNLASRNRVHGVRVEGQKKSPVKRAAVLYLGHTIQGGTVMADRHDITIAKLEAVIQLTLKMKLPRLDSDEALLENFRRAWQVVDACVPGAP